MYTHVHVHVHVHVLESEGGHYFHGILLNYTQAFEWSANNINHLPPSEPTRSNQLVTYSSVEWHIATAVPQLTYTPTHTCMHSTCASMECVCIHRRPLRVYNDIHDFLSQAAANTQS